MKNTFHLPIVIFGLIICLFSACSKDNDPPPAPPEELPAYQIEQKIRRRMENNVLVTDTLTYQYDDSGRVIRRDNSEGFYELYTYSNGKINSIKAVSNGVTSESLNFARYSDNGDTILLDFSRPNSGNTGIDTVQLTFIYGNNLILQYWTYIKNFNGSFTHLQKESFEYNSQQNLTATYFETLLTPRQLQFEVLAWDDKVNPRRGQPKLNHMLLDAGLPLQSFSLHNPVKYQDALNNVQEYQLTYNADGYPLTVKNVAADYIQTEIVYNR